MRYSKERLNKGLDKMLADMDKPRAITWLYDGYLVNALTRAKRLAKNYGPLLVYGKHGETPSARRSLALPYVIATPNAVVDGGETVARIGVDPIAQRNAEDEQGDRLTGDRFE